MSSCRLPFSRLLLGAALGLLGCQQPAYLVVTVDMIPSKSQSLAVLAFHAGQGNPAPLDPFVLMQPVPASATFSLTLPSSFGGDLQVDVGAYDGLDGQGCLLASGTNKKDLMVSTSDLLRVALAPVTAADSCSGKRPLLFAADPGLGSTNGQEPVTLSGWGFQPGSSVVMGSKSGAVTFDSSSQLVVSTPTKAGFGPTSITVTNPDGSSATRADLFHFYSPNVSMSAFAFDFIPAYSNTGGIVLGPFAGPQNLDAAFTLPAQNKVHLLFTRDRIKTGTMDYTVGNKPGPLVRADFNQDGFPDLAVANAGDGTLQLLTNDGTGQFTVGPPITVGTPTSIPAALAVGDLNGDGTPDLVVGNQVDGQVRVLVNQGGALTLLPKLLRACDGPAGLAIGDLTDDMRPDIAVACKDAKVGNPGVYEVAVLKNLGAQSGLFDSAGMNAATLPVCAQPTSVGIVDTDGNGHNDLVVSCTGDNKVSVFANMGGLDVTRDDLATDAAPRNLGFADLNGDGFDDLIVPCQGVNAVDVFLNKQGHGYHDVKALSQATLNTAPYEVFLVDFDSDGKIDLGVIGTGSIAGLRNGST